MGSTAFSAFDNQQLKLVLEDRLVGPVMSHYL